MLERERERVRERKKKEKERGGEGDGAASSVRQFVYTESMTALSVCIAFHGRG